MITTIARAFWRLLFPAPRRSPTFDHVKIERLPPGPFVVDWVAMRRRARDAKLIGDPEPILAHLARGAADRRQAHAAANLAAAGGSEPGLRLPPRRRAAR